MRSQFLIILLICVKICFSQCDFHQFKIDTDLTKPVGKALSEAIEQNPNLIDAYSALYSIGKQADLRLLNKVDKILTHPVAKNIIYLEDGYDELTLTSELFGKALKTQFEDLPSTNTIDDILDALIPSSSSKTEIVGFLSEEGISVRFFENYANIKNKSGVLQDGVKPSPWMDTEQSYKSFLKSAFKNKDDWTTPAYITKNALKERPNIAFGLSGATGLDAFAKNNNAWSFLDDFQRKGLSGTSPSTLTFDRAFAQAVFNVRQNGGKIFFNLDGIDPTQIKILDDPSKMVEGAITNFEIRNIVRNQDWFENTRWYSKGEDITDNASRLKNEFGIEPLFKGASGVTKYYDNIVIETGKYDYIFGRVVSGSQHNIDRSRQLATVMKELGVTDNSTGHALLENHFIKVGKDNTNEFSTFLKEFKDGTSGSFIVKESLFAGPSGKFAKFETTWEIINETTLRMTTIIPKL